MPVYEIVYPKDYLGLSTDTKPTNVNVGSTFYETDTKLGFIWDGLVWRAL